MESGGSKAQGGHQNCPGVGLPGQSQWPQKGKGCRCPGGIDPVHLPTRPPLSPQGGRKPPATWSSEQGTPIRSFKRRRGCAQAGGTGAPSAWEGWRSKPPGDPASGCSAVGAGSAPQPQAFAERLPSCSAAEPAAPRGGGGPRRPPRILSPRFTCRGVRRLPAAQAARPAALPGGAGSAAEPHSPASRRRRRTRSCRPCPRTWGRGSWACGAPTARRCRLQPSSCCRCLPARRTGRPGAAWPRRAPEPSRAGPGRSAGSARGGSGLHGRPEPSGSGRGQRATERERAPGAGGRLAGAGGRCYF